MDKHEDYEKHTHFHEHSHYQSHNCGHLDLQDENEHPEAHEYNRVTVQVSKRITLVNTLLAFLKLGAGVLGNSAALVADSLHAFSDCLGSLAIYLGAKISGRPENAGKPHLQEKIEGVISFLLGILLLGTAFEIGSFALIAILGGLYQDAEMPTIIPLLVSLSAIAIKEAIYFYSMNNAKKINSVGLKAMAWHNQTDALISVGSFIGILGSRLGFPVCDPLASLVISLLVLKVGLEIIVESVKAIRDRH